MKGVDGSPGMAVSTLSTTTVNMVSRDSDINRRPKIVRILNVHLSENVRL